MKENQINQLNRGILVALLSQKKILDAIQYYQSYSDYWSNCVYSSNSNEEKDFAMNELKTVKTLYYNKLLELGEDYYKEKDYDNAIIAYTTLSFISMTDLTALKHYITCLCKKQLYDLAINVSLEALAIKEDEVIIDTLSDLYNKTQNYKKAIEYKEKYLSKFNEKDISAIDLNILGVYYSNLYKQTGNYAEIETSISYCEKAYNKKQSFLYAKNITIIATLANRFDIAKKYWDICLASDEMSADDEYDYSAFCLKTKDFKNWHKYYESRFLKNKPTLFPKLKKPKWNGVDDLSNSTLLIHHEQGYGDTFLTLGYSNLIKQKAKKVIFGVPHAVYDLAKHNDFGIEVFDATKEKKDYDYYLPSMSIMGALHLEGNELSVGGGYIKADKQLTNEFKEKYFKTNKFKIGIAISGNPNGDKTRDIPSAEFLPLDKIKGIELYSITKGIPSDTFNNFKKNKVHDLGNFFNTFDDTAAAIENLDLVITSDNGLLNLAGAMGKKTFGLFNFHPQFRWFDLTGDNVVWYDSVKPFVNLELNQWQPSIQKVIKEINLLIK